MNEKDALKVIDSILKSIKEEITDNGFYYLIWGYTVLLASAIQFLLIQINGPIPEFVVWPVFMTLAGIISAIYSRKESRNSEVKSISGKFIGYLWKAFGFSIAVMLIITIYSQSVKVIFPSIIVLYGLGTYVSGSLLKFKPLIIGGIINWIIAIFVVVWVKDMPEPQCYSYTTLALSLSVLISYIIPGHLLKSEFKKRNG